MNRAHEYYQPYSWHQSHDQVTVILLVPYETTEEDVSVQFERNYLVAGVSGQQPIVKGRLYGPIDVANCLWQLEARASRLTARERTTSTTSTTSTQSSFAFLSEPDFSSGLSTSVEGGFLSDFDETVSSPALSSPVSLSREDLSNNGYPSQHPARRRHHFTTSGPVSPHTSHRPSSIASSLSSMESLHAGTSRLLTIHLEKADPTIWPSVVVGPAPETLSASDNSMFSWSSDMFPSSEAKYNMDPTSLALLGLQWSDLREDKEEAFEYLIRAWHLAHVPSAAMRLATNYVPPHLVPPDLLSPSTPHQNPSAISEITPTHSLETTPASSVASTSYLNLTDAPVRGTVSYYLSRIGSAENLAQLYIEAGLLYLEGSAPSLLTLSSPGLSSLRTPTLSHPQPFPRLSLLDPHTNPEQAGNEQWNHDQAHARRFFARARELHPALDVPLLPASHSGSEPDSHDSPVASSGDSGEMRLKMPTIDVHSSDADAAASGSGERQIRRRRRRDESAPTDSASAVGKDFAEGEDNTWYLYLPGLVGAGTALLVVGFLSFSSWRKGQGS